MLARIGGGMRTWCPALVVIIVMAVTARSHAAGPQIGPQNGPLAQPWFNPPDNPKPGAPNPFGTLFPPRTGPELFPGTPPEWLPKGSLTDPTFTFASPLPLANLGGSQPRVLCGLVIIPVDSHLDPGFVHEIPKDGITWTMQVVPPPPCEVTR